METRAQVAIQTRQIRQLKGKSWNSVHSMPMDHVMETCGLVLAHVRAHGTYAYTNGVC